MTSRRRWRGCVAGALTLTSTACRTLAPVDPRALPPGALARVALNDRGTADVAAQIGPRGRAIEGRVLTQDSAQLTLAVTSVVRAGGDEEPWRGERVAVPRIGIDQVAVPRLSRARTALVAGGIVVAALALAQLLSGEGGIFGRDPGPRPSPQ